MDSSRPAPLILFISPSPKATGPAQFRTLCDRKGVVFASPHRAGNQTPGPRRIRIVMGTLDEVRRRMTIEAYEWLERGLNDRQALARQFPASRISGTPSRSEWASLLLDEAQSRQKTDESP